MLRTSAYVVLRELFKSGGTKVYAAVVATLAAMAMSLILTPGVAHAYEVHLSVKGAGKVTEITDRGLIASDCTPGGTSGLQSPQSTPTGTVGASCSPGSPNGVYNIGDIVEYKAEPLLGFQLIGWKNADDSSSYNPVLCDNSGGSPNYLGSTATNCRFQIFENLKAQAVFADTTPPTSPSITGTSPQSGYTTGAITFFFSSTDSGPTLKGYQCSIDSQIAWQQCSSGQSFSASEGTHTLYVRSIDWSGNISSSSANRQWTVDKTLPDTTLDPAVGPQPDSTVESTDAVFKFSSNEPANATFECNLTGPGLTSTSFTPCNTSPNTSTTKSYTNLRDGSYTFKVRAKNQAGNVDDTPEQRQWTVRNAPLSSTTAPAWSRTRRRRVYRVTLM